MLNKTIKFLIYNRLISIMLLIALVCWGLTNSPFDFNIGFLPKNPVSVDAIPDIGDNQQIVFTKWKGRSPQDIEDQITYPLTTFLMGMPGVKTVRSSSMFGFSNIYIIFKDDVEFYWSRSRIVEKLNSIPKGLLPDGINPNLGPDATGLGQIFWYTIEGRDQNGNVTGGWNLQEIRSIQDYYVKNGLMSASGVSEISSIGGFVKEYQIDVNPDLLNQYKIPLSQVMNSIKNSNKDVGAKTIEVNKVEYIIRGLGKINSIQDIENTVVSSNNFTPILLKDIAKIYLGPAQRRGILDKEGAEVVGGVVVSRFGANPMKVIDNIKQKIKEISSGMPSKKLKNGSISKLTIVPFYDRSQLIKETINTLSESLILEILITVLVILVFLANIRVSILVSGLLPVAILMVFIAMKLFSVDANIVALSGIAIAIGTMVDLGIILSENITRHLSTNTQNQPIEAAIYNATSEISGAILTAVSTTIISFIPVFMLTGAEGKLFSPLAFTKTMALFSSALVTLFLIPPIATIFFSKNKTIFSRKYFTGISFIILGLISIFYGFNAGWILVLLGILHSLKENKIITTKHYKFLNIIILSIFITILLSQYWRPLGVDFSLLSNFLFVIFICFSLLGVFALFHHFYVNILSWALENKILFLSMPLAIIVSGVLIFKNVGKEFMPTLNEGSFLLMPTSLSHSGISENRAVLQKLDMAVANIPEIKTVVGKAGRTDSALDPAPISMYENIIIYYPEYKINEKGKRLKFKVNDDGLFETKKGDFIKFGTKIKAHQLIEGSDGKFYRNWRKEIKNTDDIWSKIVANTKIPGITSAPKLQPIETRLVMLQTGMRSPMGIKIKGSNLNEIQQFGIKLESILKEVKGVNKQTVFADRIVGKPYLLLDINRQKLARYGLSVNDVQQVIEVAIGGKILTQTIEGRERYGVRLRYPISKRSNPNDFENIYVSTSKENSIALGELVTVKYEKGPQVIKSENTFLVGYVLFDKMPNMAEVLVVNTAQDKINSLIKSGDLTVPNGISFEFTGTYENQIRAQKTLSYIVPLVLIAIFLVLYFQFKSISTSMMVFTSIAVAFAGGFIMIWLYGESWFLNFDLFGINFRNLFQMKTINLSVAVWVGFIALFGVATDDGVVMGTYLTQVFKKNKPSDKSSIRKSVIEAGKKRIRPCLMTTATTILALLPILTSTGRGSDIMIPMAIPSFGGMFISLITLLIVPVLFSMKEEILLNKSIKNTKSK